MVGVIEGFRWAILGTSDAPGTPFFISVGIVFLLLVLGAYIFRRTERTIVDLL
jgi:lipopolysaccharide transport system permease protein